MENKFGKTSVVKISSVLKDGEAILNDTYFTAPFKIMKPFKISKDTLSIMLLTASAGIMEGDVQEISILVGEGTKIEFLSQAYEKIHKMNDGNAKRLTKIKVEKKATLSYRPLPTIPFKDSSFINKIEVELEDNSSKLIMSDILSCGRVARGEEFEYSFYHNLVQIREKGKLIYRDNTMYDPKQMEMKAVGMYEGYSHLANMIFCNCNISQSVFDEIRDYLYDNQKILGDITHTTHGDIVVRALGNSGEALTKICDDINDIYNKRN